MDDPDLVGVKKRQVQSEVPPGRSHRPETTHHFSPPLESLTSPTPSFPASSTAPLSSSPALTSESSISHLSIHSSALQTIPSGASGIFTTPPATSGTISSTSSTQPLSSASSSASSTASSSTSSSGSSTTPSTASSASTTPLTVDNHHSHGMSSGDIAAAVVVPLLVAAVVVFLGVVWFCCGMGGRRRTRRRPAQEHAGEESFVPSKDEMGTSGFAMPLAAPTSAANPAPVITASHNNAYLSGIDTSITSRSSSLRQDDPRHRRSEGGTFVDPPPPYNAKMRKPLPPSRNADIDPSLAGAAEPRKYLPELDMGDQLVSPNGHSDTAGVDLLSPVSPLDSPEAGFLLQQRPNNHSNLSITSTLYSDSASVHSAHAAAPVRGSVISRPSVDISPAYHGTADRDSWAESDPFVDPITE